MTVGENIRRIRQERGEALLKAESDFNLWMDIYPKSEPAMVWVVLSLS